MEYRPHFIPVLHVTMQTAVGRRGRTSSRRSRALDERRLGGGGEVAQACYGQLLDGQRDGVAGAARCRRCG